MSEEDAAYSKQNESGPDYAAYYKRLVLDLLSQDGNFSAPSMEVDSALPAGKYSDGEAKGSHSDHKGRKVNRFCGSGSYFTESVGKGLSEFKKERLISVLGESATRFHREADEVYFLLTKLDNPLVVILTLFPKIDQVA